MIIKYECIYCLIEVSRDVRDRRIPRFCSNKCQGNFEFRENVVAWLSGKDKGWTGKTRSLKKFVRRYLFLVNGSACAECGWDKKHPIDGLPLTEIDHIDGDAENCSYSNLRILCPNCHSLTVTFRARNKNSKRNRGP